MKSEAMLKAKIGWLESDIAWQKEEIRLMMARNANKLSIQYAQQDLDSLEETLKTIQWVLE